MLYNKTETRLKSYKKIKKKIEKYQIICFIEENNYVFPSDCYNRKQIKNKKSKNIIK